jgi:single-stranded-DNA-specific exonuclease
MDVIRRQSPDHTHTLHAFPPLVQRLLMSRGVFNQDDVDFTLKHLLPPDNLKGVDSAANLIADSIMNNEHIKVIGDYDADGATSTALCIRCLGAMGAHKVSYLVPNRFEYGYGLSPKVVEVAAQSHPDLLITVDNGIASVAGADAAKAMGLKLVVTDHHLAAEELPCADAIVNPNQPGCSFPSKAMAGVGVAFYTMLAVRKCLRERAWFNEQKVEPNLAFVLDLVALGTIADLVPLDRNNRILAALGLERIRQGKACPGIYALLQVAKRQYSRIVSSDIAFAVAPRINAAGRLDDMSEGIECLLSDDMNQALTLAARLDELNRERKQIEVSMKLQAEAYVEKLMRAASLPKGIVVYESDWHEGVIGIVASRVKEKFYRPVIAFADSDEFVKGSARSISGLHMRDCLDLVDKQYPDLIVKFGGHAMAAGLTVHKSKLNEFEKALNSVLDQHFSAVNYQQVLLSDGELMPQEMNLQTAEELATRFPWGQAFEEPLFEGVFHIESCKVLNGGHLKWLLRQDTGVLIDAIYFNGESHVQQTSGALKLFYRLSVNEFRNNRSLQLIVEWAQPA